MIRISVQLKEKVYWLFSIRNVKFYMVTFMMNIKVISQLTNSSSSNAHPAYHYGCGIEILNEILVDLIAGALPSRVLIRPA